MKVKITQCTYNGNPTSRWWYSNRIDFIFECVEKGDDYCQVIDPLTTLSRGVQACDCEVVDESFYMVLRNGSNQINFRHDTYIDAAQEAKRLAEKTPGTIYYVLKAVSETKTDVLYETELNVYGG